MVGTLTHIAILSFAANDSLWTKTIDTVFVKSQRISFAQTGKKSTLFESQNHPTTVGNAMQQSGFFLKQYGISGSSTLSRRGSDATQTQVLWNGLPSNHSMLGMTDFNNLVSYGTNEISFIEGGNSALYGSGAVGGTLILNNTTSFKKEEGLSLSRSWQSLKNNQMAFNLFKGTSKVGFQILYARIQNNNAFNYQDPYLDQNKATTNSDFQSQLLRAVIGLKMSTKHTIKSVLEFNQATRGLGFLLGSNSFQGRQNDDNVKSVLESKISLKKWSFVNRIGYLSDRITFFPTLNDPDKSTTQNIYLQSENYYQTNHYSLLFGFDGAYQKAQTINYVQQVSRILPATFAAVNTQIKQVKLSGNARYEWYEGIPTFGISTETPFYKVWKLKTDIHTSFRRPTMNDLYWATKVRNNVTAENGWGTEIGLEWIKPLKNVQISIEMTPFYREMHRPIVWVPTGSWGWTATNLEFGKYFGLQYSGTVNLKFKKHSLTFKSSGEFVDTKVKISESPVLKSQIFIPDFVGFANVTYNYRAFSLFVAVNHNGNRYIQSDNLAWLPGYRLWSTGAQFSHTVGAKKQTIFDWNVQVSNALNSVYVNMPSRPMPPRTFELTLNIKYKK